MKRSCKARSAGIGVAIAFCFATISGCIKFGPPTTPPNAVVTPTAAHLIELTSRSKLTLPNSAQPTGWYEERGLDDLLMLRFRLPTSDLPEFLDQPKLKGLTLTTDNYGSPHSFRVFGPIPSPHRKGQQLLAPQTAVNVILDEQDPKMTVVYLEYMGT